MRTGVASAQPRIASMLAGYGLIGAMVAGAVSTVTLVPLGCLWIASTLTGSATAGVLFALVAVPTAMVFTGAQLVRLDRLYARVTGRSEGPRVAPAYRRALTDTGQPQRTTVLEGVMVASVLITGGLLCGWFFFLAGSPLPA